MKIVKYKALIARPLFIIAHPPGHPSSIAFSSLLRHFKNRQTSNRNKKHIQY